MSATPHILLVDDDADLRQCLVDVLEDAGYLVQTASSGREALRLLDGADLPQLILLDLMMPDLNGWQFYEQKQKVGRLADIPVLVVTASRALGASFPGSEVLLKPFSVETVVEKVEQLVGRLNN
ncbi:MAG TPA: response regulator [Polyangia bacterium]|nr:response regulator [Polyangia bacterium]